MMVNKIQWPGQEATNSAYYSKDSLLAKYPTGRLISIDIHLSY